MLLAVVVLPIVLFETVALVTTVPSNRIPRNEFVPAPAMVMAPTLLLEIVIAPGVPVPARIPEKDAPAPAPVQVMFPVPVVAPIVLPVVVPIFMEPVTAEIPALIVDADDVEILMF